MSPSTRAAINRANATHSTGPVTELGKQRASLNAVSHGLTGNRMILQPHEQEAYARLTASLNADLAPATESERQFVQKIIDCHTRLNRIAALETNLLNIGMVEQIEPTPHEDSIECMAAQARAWLAQDTSFEKLGRYEARLSRQLLQYTKELERLQQARKSAEQILSFAAAEAESEERYFRSMKKGKEQARRIIDERQARQSASEVEAPEPLTPELASFCQSHPALKAAFELYDPNIFNQPTTLGL
jgi:chromosome segregation ATPase